MDRTQLNPADIILTSRPFSDSPVSTAIKAGTVSPYSHAMIYVGDNHVVEAVGEGVVRRGLSLALYGCDRATVFRHSAATLQQRQQVIAFAMWSVGGEYAVPGVATASGAIMATPLGVALSAGRTVANAALSLTGRRRSYFCSELVADSYLSAGLPLGIYGRTPSFMNPGDIAEFSDRNPAVLVNLGGLA